MAKLKDEPLKIDLSFEDALRRLANAKPLPKTPRTARNAKKKR